MKTILSLALVLVALITGSFVAASSAAQEETKPATFDHRMLTMLLERHVKEDRVDYVGLQRDRAMLDAYAKRLTAVTPKELGNWEKNERFAFWINVYNTFTLQLILDNYPLVSINDLAKEEVSPWDQPLIPMQGFHPDKKKVDLTLNDVEQRILRPTFKDARVHAAVNCASKGCPPLRAEAFEGAKLEAQLDEQMKAFLADRNRNRFEPKTKKVVLNKIFEWYADDFVDAKADTDLGDFLLRFAPPSAGATPTWIQTAAISFSNYDWTLNDIDRKKQ